jgi:hypothetical protein
MQIGMDLVSLSNTDFLNNLASAAGCGDVDMKYTCWTQNPYGPSYSCKTRDDAIAWAKRQNRSEACGYVLFQGRARGKLLPVEIYNISAGNLS